MGHFMKNNVDTVKTSLIGRIGAWFARLSEWIAKGYEENPPCRGG
jgi:hypothetical protein